MRSVSQRLARPTCLLLLVALAAPVLASDAHAESRSDVTPYKDARRALPELRPAAVIVRTPIEELRDGLAGIDSTVGELETQLSEETKRPARGANAGSRRLEDQLAMFEKMESASDRFESILDELRLDEKRPIYAAVTTWNGASFLTDLGAMFMPRPSVVPGSLHVRLAAPVDGADAIEASEAARLNEEENWATIDLRVPAGEDATDVELADDIAPPDDAGAAKTPAHRAFSRATTPSALYVNFDALDDAATVVRAQRLRETLDAAAQKGGGRRPAFFSTYREEYARLTEAYCANHDGYSEYADAAIWGDIGAAAMGDSHMLATRTEHGARIRKAATAEPVELPVGRKEETISTLEMAYDFAAAAPRALAADWATEEPNSPASLKSVLGGPDATPPWRLTNQPGALLSVFSQAEIAPNLPVPDAVRLHLYRAKEGSQLYDDIPDRLADRRRYPMALSAAFERSESVRIRLEYFLEQMSSGDFLDLDWTFEEAGDNLILRVTRHGTLEEYFGEAPRREAPARLRVAYEPEAVAKWYDETTPDFAPDLPKTLIDSAPDEALIEAKSKPAATLVSMTDREATQRSATPQLDPRASPVPNDEKRPACLPRAAANPTE